MTPSRIRFHPDAEAELIAGALWYEEHSSNLGLDFLATLELELDRLLANPGLGRQMLVTDAGAVVRRVLTPRFPYGVIYLATSVEIQVLAIAHLRRKPGYWKERV